MRNRLGNACDSLDIMLFQYIARVQNLGFFVGTVINDDDDEGDNGDYGKAYHNGKAGLRHLITLKPENITNVF